ncbi:MAG: FAD-dependent oxidoreductase [Candidatus Bathyarchaeota archaeon]|nr:MAG: FAD-dependent oxidoreductase [Candidatus Bathyarchaeota archaeon]
MSGKKITSKRVVIEPERSIPVTAKVDVLVAGGGAAGFGAAIGAARTGARTMVVERNNCLGGTATAGMMANLNVTGPHLIGVAHELLCRLADIDRAWFGRVVTFSPELMKQVMLEMLEEEGVKPLFYTMISQPIVEDNTVKGVIVENKSGRQAILSKAVVDCTGDADLAYRAGAPCTVGREEDHKTRPMTLLFRLGNVGIDEIIEYCREHPDQFIPSPYWNVLQKEKKVLRIEGFYDIMEAARKRGELDSNIHYLRFEGVDTENGTIIVNTSRVYDLDGTDAQQLSIGEIEARRQMMQILQVIRKWVPGCEDAFLINSATNLGVRETRRIIGEYVFTHEDAGNKVRFNDTVARLWRRAGHKWLAGMPGVEMHSPDAGEGLRDEAFNQRMKTYDPDKIPPPPEKDFYFPYRSLIPQKLDGILVAGRSMSVSHLGDTWTRGIMIVMVCGQAAGTAAALAAKDNVEIRGLDISRLQKELIDQGVELGEEGT